MDDLFRIDADGTLTLLGGRCRVCGHTFFPSAEVCPYSADVDVENVDLAGAGTLWGWTAVTAAPPGYHGPVPYGFGIVELEGGLRVVGRITVGDPKALSFGQPMMTVADSVPIDDGDLLTWAFAPVTQP